MFEHLKHLISLTASLLLRLAVRIQTTTDALVESLAARVRTAPQTGQGTVEYVALILLVAGVLAAAVAATSKADGGIGKVITEKLKAAITAGK